MVLRFLPILLFFGCTEAFADLSYRDSVRLGSTDRFDLGRQRQGSLQDYRIVDLSASVDVGSNCGQMNVGANLRANMKEFLNGDFFKGLGNQITDAGGLLALCYLSPAMCSITKNLRITSGLTSAMDLEACSLIEKYQDQQIAVYERERSQCVRSELKRNGNNVKEALKSCGENSYENKIRDWAGGENQVPVNRLIESTAKWAGLTGNDAANTIELTKAFVGDTVIGKGGIDVDFGKRNRIYTPTDLIEDEQKFIAKQLNDYLNYSSSSLGVKDEDVVKIFEDRIPLSTGRRIVQKLSYLPQADKEMFVQKISKAIATQSSVEKMEKSMELLQLASRNPNVPDAQRLEAKQLSEQLKSSLELSLRLKNSESESFEKTLSQAFNESQKYENWEFVDGLSSEKLNFDKKSLKSDFLDCTDRVFCSEASDVLN